MVESSSVAESLESSVDDFSSFWAQRIFGSMLIPLPSCFGEKRLEGVENKGSKPTKAEKRARILLKTLRPSLQREA
jgi:hypothetical protein